MLSTILFLLFVALAVYIQNLTGFALALVLLGLVGATNVFPLPDVVNVVSVIALVNAFLFLRARRALRLDRLMWPALSTNVVGTILGVASLAWIMGNAYEGLRLLLGLSVVLCAWMLWKQARPLQTVSSRASFYCVGLVSGLMGGLFSAAGPPLVYHVYRQPWPLERMRESLVFIFGAGALLRLTIVIPTTGFSTLSLTLSALAIPVVALMTFVAARHAPPVSPRIMKWLVCSLLVTTGVTMMVGAARVLFA
ncbi:TSUP family transporter [Achromobacter sp. GG226]|uniref:TSUP family transporter n=1 Tax=Verticiella alkaliphila TaxID=2779529 RepID=UPI001C0AE555|nr:TSUP family transporter [Verticiella sp. GG226]MBU4611729.1 TSUP family transporter [Verticiella sp. GG226]